MLRSRLAKSYREWLGALFLVLLFGWIAWVNFPRGVFFTGWDALHPEFNFAINWQRAIQAVWQENYGVGTMAGHGFAALIPHVAVTWLMAQALPLWAVRPAFLLLMYLVGGLGMYWLGLRLLARTTFSRHLTDWWRIGIALVGTLFYWFNLATVQQFYVPLEAFVVQYAAWPWLIGLVVEYLHQPKKGRLLMILVANFLASVQGFIPSLFAAYGMGLGVFLLTYVVEGHWLWKRVKAALAVLITVLVANLYWLLPVGYYSLTHNQDFLSAYNNSISTPEFIDKSKGYGDLVSVAFLKSFFLDGQQPNGPVFAPWLNHMNQGVVSGIGLLLFGVVVVGWGSLWFRKEYWAKPMAILGLVFFGSLASETWPFSWLIGFVQQASPLIAQAFRTAFTKFGLGLGFGYSVCFVMGMVAGRHVLSQARGHKWLSFGFVVMGGVMIVIWGWPVMAGHLFNNQLKVAIPESYFEMMDYFATQPMGRIAELPIECSEGWFAQSWGYYGSGFWWYGVKQPVLVRTFDVWSRYNEDFYWEALQALRQPDHKGLLSVLRKYQVQWLVVDSNMAHCRSSNGLDYEADLLTYLHNQSTYHLVKTFADPALPQPLTVFAYSGENAPLEMVDLLNQPVQVQGDFQGTEQDQAYADWGDYVTAEAGADVDYPYRELITKNVNRTDSQLLIGDTQIVLSAQTNGGVLVMPAYEERERVLPVTLQLTPLKGDIYQASLMYQGPSIVSGERVIWQAPTEELGKVIIHDFNTVSVMMDSESAVKTGESAFTTAAFSHFDNTLYVYDQGKVQAIWESQKSEVYRDYAANEHQIHLDNGGSLLKVEVPKIYDQARFGNVVWAKDLTDMPEPCDNNTLDNGIVRYEFSRKGEAGVIRMMTQKNRQCLRIAEDEMRPADGYVMQVAGTYESGMAPSVRVTNWRGIDYYQNYVTSKGDFQTVILLPPVFEKDLSYTVEMDSVSFGSETAISDFKEAEYWFIPYRFLKSMRVDYAGAGLGRGVNLDPSVYGVKQINGAVFSVSLPLNMKSNTYLVLHEGFDRDWKAVMMDDCTGVCRLAPGLLRQSLKQVKVNGWENGWIVPSDGQTMPQVMIVYWPQYLEWMGLGLLLGVFGFLGLSFGKLRTRNWFKRRKN